jgi:hypothetical protein
MSDSIIPNSGLPAPAPKGSQVFGVGALGDEIYLGERTRVQLREFGWTDGDPIPPNLTKIIQTLRQEYAAELVQFEKENPQEANKARGGLFNFTGLPAAARAEIAAIFQTYRTGNAAQPAPVAPTQEQAPPGFTPGFNPVIDASAVSGFVVDSLDLPKKASIQTEKPAVTASDDAEFIKAQIFGKPVAPAPEPQEDTQSQAETGLDKPAVAFCPRCFWDLRKDFPVEPTKQDIQEFVLAILANQCFSKTYTLFDGRVAMRLQALSAKASAMVRNQLAVDTKKMRILEAGDYLATMTDYRMMFMLRELHIGGNPPIEQVFPEITTLSSRDADETPLRGYVEVFYSDLLVSESLIRVARQTAFEFGALCEKLESMAVDPSFWKGIVT